MVADVWPRARHGSRARLQESGPEGSPHLTILPAARLDSLDALIRQARLGDLTAFAELVDRYYPRCLRFAQHMLGNSLDAEEAVQDAFVRVHKALASYTEQDRFEPWLFRILANRCRTLRARERRHAQVMQYGDVPDDVRVALQPEISEDWNDELKRALSALPSDQREAFLLRHVEDMGYEDMSAATGAGVSALKMRVKRACDFLRARLTEVAGD